MSARSAATLLILKGFPFRRSFPLTQNGWSADGVVLVWSAAPGLGRFRDYRGRGEAFARALRVLADR
jgi:hypothetical protein